MKDIHGVSLIPGSNEELLPDFFPDFPYIASRTEMIPGGNTGVPWHWHHTVELFYVESGTLEYTTPEGKQLFPAGWGGFVNSGVLHQTRTFSGSQPVVTLLHLFEPDFLAGAPGSRIDQRYIRPLTSAPGLEILRLSPEVPEQAAILSLLQGSFTLSETEMGYEMELRYRLGKIWLGLLELAKTAMPMPSSHRPGDDKLKIMLQYVHDHFSDPIRVEQIAQSAHVSKRVCFRLFQDSLHTTPVAYLTSCRLQRACRMLTETDAPITRIAYDCCLGSSSYFGKLFRAHFGCSPAAYRGKWQDRYKERQD